MLETLARGFVRFWKAREIPPHDPDAIVAICYGTLQDRLADGTMATLDMAIVQLRKYPNAQLVAGNADICFPGSDAFENREKRRILAGAGIAPDRILTHVINNTVTEGLGTNAALANADIACREVLIIAAEAHSRSVMYIFRRTLPAARLSLMLVPFRVEYQPDHTVTLQTGPWYWIAANVARQIALWTLGLTRVGRVRHHTRIRS